MAKQLQFRSAAGITGGGMMTEHRVLIVEDSARTRSSIEAALESRALGVSAVACGRDALARLEVEDADLVICDVQGAEPDGYELSRAVRARHSGTRVLLLSDDVRSVVLQRAAQAQADGVVFKPFAPETLARKVVNLLDGSGADGETGADRPPFRESLERLVAVPGVRAAVLADREGFLIDAAGPLEPTEQTAAALAACLADFTEGIGGELNQGPLERLVLEYESSLLLLQSVGPAAVLAVLVVEPAALATVIHSAKSLLPALVAAL